MMRFMLAVSVFFALVPAAIADDLSADVQAYVDRRKACNYWPSEQASRKSEKLRRGEIQRHIRELNCPTLDREEAVLNARYKGKPDILAAVADAHDAMPD
jgi:predicted PP-loop superfamily ATPase